MSSLLVVLFPLQCHRWYPTSTPLFVLTPIQSFTSENSTDVGLRSDLTLKSDRVPKRLTPDMVKTLPFILEFF